MDVNEYYNVLSQTGNVRMRGVPKPPHHRRSASRNSSGSNVKDELEALSIKQLTEFYHEILGGTGKVPKTKSKIIDMIFDTLKSKGSNIQEMKNSINAYKLVIEGGSRKRSYTRKRR